MARKIKIWVIPEFKDFLLKKRAENPKLKTFYDVQKELMEQQPSKKKTRFFGKL